MFAGIRMAAVGLGALLLAAAPVMGQTVTFTRQLNVNDQIQFDVRMKGDFTISIAEKGEQPRQERDVMEEGQRGTVVVNAVDANAYPTTVTVTMDPSGSGPRANNGMEGRMLQFKLEGGSFTMRSTTGEDTEIVSFSRDMIEDMIFPGRVLLPTQPVEVGGQWNIAPDDLAMLLPTGDGSNMKGTGRLIGVETVNGRQVATIELAIAGTGQSQEGAAECDLKGVGTADVASSRMIDMTVTGTFKMTMRDENFSEEHDGVMTYVMKASLVGHSASPAAPPAQTGGEGANFHGTFAAGDIVIALQRNGSAISGTLQRGQTSFPIESAAINANTINGKFRAGEKLFDFSGTLAGDALAFSTGNKTYTLQRQTDPNEGNPFN